MEDVAGRPEWLVIVNPNAGRGKGQKDWTTISALLTRYNLVYESRFTQSRRHAVSLAQQGIENGFRKIIVVGGDGTMNEVVNGIFTQTVCPTTDIVLSTITVGTGNDWGKMFSIPLDYERAIRVIKEGKIRLQDTGVVYYYHGIRREKRYFLNIAGLGFDAVVVRRTNLQKDKGHSGKAIYLINLLKSLILYRHTATEVEIDGNKIQHDVF